MILPLSCDLCANWLGIVALPVISVTNTREISMSRETHCAPLDGWHVSWEVQGGHRLWCKQEQPGVDLTMAVVMLNPGSLSGKGENLTSDLTLRILREIFLGTGFNPLVVNLFTFATTDPYELFANWGSRDAYGFELDPLLIQHAPAAVLYAYGAYEKDSKFGVEILARIREVRRAFAAVPEVSVPLSKQNTPKHPRRIQLEKLKPEYRELIRSMAKRKE